MAKSKSNQVQFSRVDFFRLHGEEFFGGLFDSVERVLGDSSSRKKRWAGLNTFQQGLWTWWCFWGELFNGGLTQYFLNHTDTGLPALERLLTASGNSALADLLDQATKIYRKHKKEFSTLDPWGDDGLFGQMTELAELDRPAVKMLTRTIRRLEKWLRANISRVEISDLGDPIDPQFSGLLETRHSNGKPFEVITIRRGKVHGPYRRYFPDGNLEHACFYEGGRVSASYWPNGQPRRKTTKNKTRVIDEWFYQSGAVQKRFVADKSGKAVEPVQMWYENGQLAEATPAREEKQIGAWLKFFGDGSPRLEAEYRKNGKLIIKNAWDDKRTQTVKRGDGTYLDDGLSIDISHDLFFKSSWTRSQELQDGVPHGTCTTWHSGVLWSRDEWVKGKHHGESTLYYENGRVQSRCIYRHDRQIAVESFPKFDNPRPAVLLRVEANAKLYEAWGHPRLDTYPTPRNLAKLQAKLVPPPFLQEIFEQNKSGTLKDEYDDLNTFNDNIAYLVVVDESGNVVDVTCSGSDVYSAATIEEYPAVIRKLKFKPGRIGKRNVGCRVVIFVHHTFVESTVPK